MVANHNKHLLLFIIVIEVLCTTRDGTRPGPIPHVHQQPTRQDSDQRGAVR